MFGPETTYGTSERIVRPCRICSSVENITYVTPDTFDHHAARHQQAWNEYLADQAAEAAESLS